VVNRSAAESATQENLEPPDIDTTPENKLNIIAPDILKERDAGGEIDEEELKKMTNEILS